MIKNLKIKTRGLPNKIEKFILSNINLKPPKSYAKISDTELSNVYEKSIQTFPNNKDQISKNVIQSIRANWIKNHMITHHKNLLINSKQILKSYKNNSNVLELSERYDVSPLNIIRFVFNKLYHKKLTKLINNPNNLNNLDEYDRQQLNIAIENDAYAIIDNSKIKDESIEFEKLVQKVLDTYSVKYKTQDELTEEQIKEYGKPINTPDFLIISDLYINDMKINWIDAKNFYGSNIPFVKEKIEVQTKKYLDKWGSGCVVFNLGFNEEIKYPNILLTDYKNLKNSK
jgi:hypothetical protein